MIKKTQKMTDKKKRQSKCKYDNQKNTKGGVGSLAVTNIVTPRGQPQRKGRQLHKQPATRGLVKGVSIPNSHDVPVKPMGSSVGKQVKLQRNPSFSVSTRRQNFFNSQQKHLFASGLKETLSSELNQLQEYFHGLVLERMLVCNNTCNKDGVEILSTSCDGQQPPGGGKNVVILDYQCFEDESTKEQSRKSINDSCCTPPIKSNCKNLINLIKELLKEILSEFFRSASSPEIFKFDIAKVAKACVVSYFIETITTQLFNESNSNSLNKNELIKFYIKVSVQTMTGGKVNTAKDFLVHVNVNSLKNLFEVPNINVLTSSIIKNELKNIVNEIQKPTLTLSN